MKTKTMMSGTNLIIVVVLVGGYFVYKKYYTKKTPPIKPLPIKPILDGNGNPVTPIKPPLDDKGNAIEPTPISQSSFDSFDDDGL
jgi:uncharacterized protein YneF (UPF0154 family)